MNGNLNHVNISEFIKGDDQDPLKLENVVELIAVDDLDVDGFYF